MLNIQNIWIEVMGSHFARCELAPIQNGQWRITVQIALVPPITSERVFGEECVIPGVFACRTAALVAGRRAAKRLINLESTPP